MLKIKAKTIMKWVYEQKIPFIRFGHGQKAIVRFSPHKLNNWLNSFSHDHGETQGAGPGAARKPKQASKKTINDFNEFAAET